MKRLLLPLFILAVVNNGMAQITECNDGIDNDGDGLTDWENDLGCYGADDNSERGAYSSGHLIGGNAPTINIGPFNTKTEFGWTTIDPSAGTRIVYVSSSAGNDSNSGLHPDSAVKTLNKAYSLLRDSMPDWMLLKRGDTWIDEDLSSGFFNKNGRSAEEKIVVSSYGSSTRRPVLINGQWRNRDMVSPTNNVAIMGIEFYARKHDPSSIFYNDKRVFAAINRLAPGEGFLLEDLYLRYATMTMDIFGKGISGLTMRRCIVTDSFSDTSGHAQGTYIKGITDSALIEECIYDANGWYYPDGEAGIGKTTWFNHNFYIKEAKGLIMRNNIIARASGAGIKTSSDQYHAYRDFIYDNNLFIGGEAAAGLNQTSGVKDSTPTHYNFKIINNVITQQGRWYAGNNQYRAGGIRVYYGEKAEISNNYFLHKTFTHATNGVITIGGGLGPNKDIDVKDNIIFNWLDHNPLRLTGATSTNVNFTNNIVNTNPGFVDSARSIESYHAMLGKTADLDSFMLQSRKQSRFNWRNEYTAQETNCYIKAGFCTTAQLCTAGFLYSANGLQVSFVDTSKLVDFNNTCNIPMLWDFGDGTESTLANPSHNYTAPGTYTVSQITGNACGTDTATAVITITGTNTEENENLSGIHLFPNPAQNNLHIIAQVSRPQSIRIIIHNMLGEIIFSENTNADYIFKHNIYLGDDIFSGGIYILSIQGENFKSSNYFSIVK